MALEGRLWAIYHIHICIYVTVFGVSRCVVISAACAPPPAAALETRPPGSSSSPGRGRSFGTVSRYEGLGGISISEGPNNRYLCKKADTCIDIHIPIHVPVHVLGPTCSGLRQKRSMESRLGINRLSLLPGTSRALESVIQAAGPHCMVL